MDGTAFQVYNPVEFAKIVMEFKFFKMSSYASFQRQVNLYDFTRISKGPPRGAFQHPLFVKGRPLLACRMKRNVAKSSYSTAVDAQMQADAAMAAGDC